LESVRSLSQIHEEQEKLEASKLLKSQNTNNLKDPPYDATISFVLTVEDVREPS
jgi:hypothetical protein